jgi:hypothetical protein
MKLKYKRVDTSTVEGIRQAERLVALGWKVIQIGLFILLLEKRGEK